MPADPFVHLHVHSDYSLLDSTVRINDLVQKAKACGMPAVALTDHGNLYGAIEFYQTAKKAEIQPIIGCELYVAPGSRHDQQASSAKGAYFHLTVLCQNETGYKNLIKLVTAGYLEGFYYKPRVDKELLAKLSQGLLVLSGCVKGELHQALQSGDFQKALDTAAWYRDIFGKDRYFIELHDHNLEVQHKHLPDLLKIARELDLKVVAANDVHFLERKHHEAHDVLLCIGTNNVIYDQNRRHYSPELYFKTSEEMEQLFRNIPEAIKNTLLIAESCQLTIDFKTNKYPTYTPPNGSTPQEYLRQLCLQGLKERYGTEAETNPELLNRLNYELSVIERTGFASYFLIVWDFIHFAKSQSIPVGPGRGSAAGSLIAYCLKITDIDPLRYGLIFERFLNPERISPPDIDVDFCMERRGEVFNYVREKYGPKAVAKIITFGTLGAKSVIRDVCRVLGWSYSESDTFAKLIPEDLNITLKQAEEKNKELREFLNSSEKARQVWDYANVLEGLNRNSSIHAAGVVIADKPLDEYIPLALSEEKNKKKEVVTQYSMNPLTDLGMLKMDFLGLKTLTAIQQTVNFIRKRVPDFDLSKIPLDDQPTFDLLNRGETVGVFQLEGSGITNCCKMFDIRSLDDIMTILALYRPGPMQFIPDYVERKKGLQPIQYAHPLLEKVCADTYGIIIYQEQVQRAANVLAGYSLGQADLLRRAMGKKDKEKMAKERENFVAGCAKTNNIPPEQANAIFDFIAKFAEYGFNKSHSAAYGMITYQTAWLKAHYPVEFMAGLLSSELDKTEKIASGIAECRRMKIAVLPPDINESDIAFTPADFGGQKAIRFGLAAIKNVGLGVTEEILAVRRKEGSFTSLHDFCAKVGQRSLTKKTLESLIKVGALDSLDPNRAKLFAQIEQATSYAGQVQRDRESGQASLFAEEIWTQPQAISTEKLSIPQWSRREQLEFEKELLGYYVSGHPLEDHLGTLESADFTQIASLPSIESDCEIKIGGLLTAFEKKFLKSNRIVGEMQIEDLTGIAKISVWEDKLEKYKDLFVPGQALALEVRAQVRNNNNLRLTCLKAEPLKKRATKQPVSIRLNMAKTKPKDLQKISEIFIKNKGKRSVEIIFVDDQGWEAVTKPNKSFAIQDEIAVRRQLAAALPEILISS